MLAPSTETAADVPLKRPARAKVDLIAWDPESPAHAERMVQHRIACGWKQDYIEGWRVLQREGKMGLHWVVSFSFLFLERLIIMSSITLEKQISYNFYFSPPGIVVIQLRNCNWSSL